VGTGEVELQANPAVERTCRGSASFSFEPLCGTPLTLIVRSVAHIPPMQTLYFVAAGLCFALGLVHSVLGERYILIRLFRRTDLPKLFGGTEFTARTLRFAWHLTSVAWWGSAALFCYMARDRLSYASVAGVLAGVFLVSAVVTLVASRGRHLAWPVFLAIGLIALYGSQA